MSDTLQEDQERVQAALQACTPREDGVGPDDGALVVGWVVLCEWVAPDGERWLTKLTNPNCTIWQQQGYLHNGLNTGWDADQ